MKGTNLPAPIAIGLLAISSFVLLLPATATAKDVTLTYRASSGGPYNQASDTVTVETNETAEVTSLYGEGGNSETWLQIAKNGITNRLYATVFTGIGTAPKLPIIVAGPATISLKTPNPRDETWFCTIKITPDSFPPDKTIILPEGTVGIVHLESSTNLVEWHDEWTHTFANTNENRFFRIRADRSLP